MIKIEDIHIYHTSMLLRLVGRSKYHLLTVMVANASISSAFYSRLILLNSYLQGNPLASDD